MKKITMIVIAILVIMGIIFGVTTATILIKRNSVKIEDATEPENDVQEETETENVISGGNNVSSWRTIDDEYEKELAFNTRETEWFPEG